MDNNEYRRSWINHLSTWIDHLPGTSNYYYLGLSILLLAVQSLVAWIEGALEWGKFLPQQFFLSAAIVFILAVIPFYDQQALKAFLRFLPISTSDEDTNNTLRRKLSTLRTWPTFFASLIVVVIVYLLEVIGTGPYRLEEFSSFPISTIILWVVYYLCWWCYGAFLYHTIHQLSVINQIYTKYTRVNIFRMKPLYGFSDLSALTAGSLIVLPYGFVLANPGMTLTDPIVLGIYVVLTLIALITFILPQLGIHRLQQDEKDRLLDEAYMRYQDVMADLHNTLEEKDYDSLSKLNTASGMIEKEIETIKGISTWPWQPETVRWLFTALVLPVLMWLGQYFLGKILG
jgi:hypothetical protein